MNKSKRKRPINIIDLIPALYDDAASTTQKIIAKINELCEYINTHPSPLKHQTEREE